MKEMPLLKNYKNKSTRIRVHERLRGTRVLVWYDDTKCANIQGKPLFPAKMFCVVILN